MKSRNALAACCLLLLGTACRKEVNLVELLPPASQTGQNMFACILKDEWVLAVHGEYESAGMGIISSCKGGCEVRQYSSAFQIFATNCSRADWRFTISVNDSVHVGTFPLGGASANSFRIENRKSVDGGTTYTHYETTSEATGSITFTRFDDSVCAGTFSTALSSVEGAPDFSAREGRFDIRLQ